MKSNEGMTLDKADSVFKMIEAEFGGENYVDNRGGWTLEEDCDQAGTELEPFYEQQIEPRYLKEMEELGMDIDEYCNGEITGGYLITLMEPEMIITMWF